MQISSFTPYLGPSPTKTTSTTGAASAASGTDATTASSPTTTPVTKGLDTSGNDVAKEFLDYAKMSPMERMRANILKSMGLTEDDLKKMSPEQQKAVEQKIEQIIKQELQKNAGKTGQVVNLSA
jgi:hypothetical protein